MQAIRRRLAYSADDCRSLRPCVIRPEQRTPLRQRGTHACGERRSPCRGQLKLPASCSIWTPGVLGRLRRRAAGCDEAGGSGEEQIVSSATPVHPHLWPWLQGSRRVGRLTRGAGAMAQPLPHIRARKAIPGHVPSQHLRPRPAPSRSSRPPTDARSQGAPSFLAGRPGRHCKRPGWPPNTACSEWRRARAVTSIPCSLAGALRSFWAFSARSSPGPTKHSYLREALRRLAASTPDSVTQASSLSPTGAVGSQPQSFAAPASGRREPTSGSGVCCTPRFLGCCSWALPIALGVWGLT